MAMRYKPNQVKEQSTPLVLDRTRANSASFGGNEARADMIQAQQIGQIGQAVGQVADQVAEYEARQQARENKVATQDMVNQYDNLTLNEMKKAKATKGMEAANLDANVQKTLQDEQKRMMSSLDNEEQKLVFKASSDNSILGARRVAIGHQTKQIELAKNNKLKASNELAVQTARENREDPTFTETAEGTIAANTREIMRGQSPEMIKLSIEAGINDLHTSNLEGFVKDSAVVGQKYLKDNWKKFTPGAERDKLKTTIDGLAKIEKGSSFAQEAFNSGAPLDKQLSEANKISDKVTRETALKDIKARDKQKTAVAEEQNRQEFNGTFYAIAVDPNTEIDKAIALKDPAKYKQLLAWKNQLSSQTTNKMTKTGMEEYLRLDNLSYESLQKENMADYIGIMPASDIKKFSERQRDSREHTNVQTLNSFVNSLVARETEKGEIEGAEAILTEFTRRVNELPKDERSNPKNLQDIADKMTMKVTFEGEGFLGAFVGSDPYWKAVRDKKTGIVPADMPENIKQYNPKWVNYVQDGKRIEGWVHTRTDGRGIINQWTGGRYVPSFYDEDVEVANN